MKIKYRQISVPISELKPNCIHEKLKLSVDKFYAAEAAKFNFYQLPVVTEDNIVLSNYNDVLAATVNQKSEIDVLNVAGLEKDDWLRFISHDVFFKNLSYAERYILILELQIYLTKNKNGIAWAKEIEGDINKKIGTIINYHKEYVKLLKRIGDKDKAILDSGGTLEEMVTRANAVALGKVENPKSEENKNEENLEALNDITLSFSKNGPEVFFKKHPLNLLSTEPKIKGRVVSYSLKTLDNKSRMTISINNLTHLLKAAQG